MYHTTQLLHVVCLSTVYSYGSLKRLLNKDEVQNIGIVSRKGLPQIFLSRKEAMYLVRLSQCKIQRSFQVVYSRDNLCIKSQQVPPLLWSLLQEFQQTSFQMALLFGQANHLNLSTLHSKMHTKAVAAPDPNFLFFKLVMVINNWRWHMLLQSYSPCWNNTQEVWHDRCAY